MTARVDPTPDDLDRFLAAGPDGEIVMLNLLRMADGGAESYRQYAEAVVPFLDGVGGSLLYAGVLAAPMVAPDEHDWDAVLLVRYPDRAAFGRMVTNPDYLAITHLRTRALSAAVLQPSTAGLP